MPLDREATLRQAERFLRQGRLDGAIAEYVRLVEDQPRDWNAINALGDLYARAGDGERAAAQFTRVGDYFYAEGFLPKAAALYKKALKVTPAHEAALLRLGEIAARLGMLADAKVYFRQLADQRRARGDDRGAAECLVRLARLEGADAESKIAGARAAVHLGETAVAGALLKEAGSALEKQRRRPEALDAFHAAARLAPGDADLLLGLARLEIESARDARSTILRVLSVAPHRYRDVLPLVEWLAAAGLTESAGACAEVLADLALLEGDDPRALLARIGIDQGTIEKCLPREGGSQPDAGSRQDAPAPAAAQGGTDLEAIEIDLSDLLAELQPEPAPMPAPAVDEPPAPDIETVFEEFRARAAGGQQAATAAERYQRGLEHLLDDRVDEAIADLQAVARIPLFRFQASAQLGRLHRDQGDLQAAVDWLERAAEAPAPTIDDGHAVLYELAGVLEQLGESARALAVLIELEADAGDYRDVRARLQRLSREANA